MENYQIIEQLGKGKFSTVYKGRKKRTIEYFAIKSVDKSIKGKVLNEVKTMHSLDHINILKFHQWYETNNHFWLILEYCPGGNLYTLMKEDDQLPEHAIQTLGLDLIEGLQHLHANGILHCDLNPSNILIDGCGLLKFSGFGLSQRLSDLSKSNNSTQPKRGVPHYMAPELFDEDGVHSFASDLWSLGCMLYQMASGSPPFASENLQELMNQILEKPIQQLEDYSEELNQLLDGLLAKNPTERLSWKQVVTHEFWQTKIPILEMPRQIHYEIYLKQRQEMLRKSGLDPKSSLSNSVNVDRLYNRVNQKMERENYRDRNSNDNPASKVSSDMEINFASDSDDEDRIEEDEDSESPSSARMSGSKRPSSAPVEHNPPTHFVDDRDPRPTSAAPGVERRTFEGGVDPAFFKHSHPSHSQGLINDTNELEELEALYHPSDMFVKPIVNNNKIEKVIETSYNSGDLPFHDYLPDDFLKLDATEQGNLFTSIYRAVISDSNLQAKYSTLCYVEQLAYNLHAANLLINCTLMFQFVKMVQSETDPRMKERVCSVIGVLVRHATYITFKLSQSEILDILIQCVSNEDEQVRHRAAAALGELLFYIATQEEDELPENELWVIPEKIAKNLLEYLEPGNDEIVQHYFAKTIENIAARSSYYSTYFAVNSVVPSMLNIFTNTQNTHLRSTSITVLARLSRYTPTLISDIIDKLGVKQLVNKLHISNPRCQSALLNIINLALAKYPMKLKLDNVDIITQLIRLAESSNVAVRGKSWLCIHLVSKRYPSQVPELFEKKLISLLERSLKEKDDYVIQNIEILKKGFSVLVPSILKQVAQDLEGNRMNTSNTLPGNLSVVSHCITSSSTNQIVVNEAFIISLARCLDCVYNSEDGYIKKTLMLITESLSQNPSLSIYYSTVTTELLPAILNLLESKSGDQRFSWLKMFTDILVRFLNDKNIYPGGNSYEGGVKAINQLITKRLFPRFNEILTDEDPIPAYGLKLLNNIAEHKKEYIPHIQHHNLIPKIFEFFELEHKNNNVHNVMLIRKLIESHGIDKSLLFKHDLIRKLNSVFTYAIKKRVEIFFEPCLEIVDSLFFHTAHLLYNAHNGNTTVQSLSNLMYQECRLLADRVSVYLQLCSHADPYIADVSSHCVVLCAQLYTSCHDYISSSTALNYIQKAMLKFSDDTEDVNVCMCLLQTLLLVLSNSKQVMETFHQDDNLHVTIHNLAISDNEDIAELASRVEKYIRRD
eukprot:gb/GECH01000355.1/.p1 GENE.gb/GECH01000355.1/~~gb/GECH01000355.1/.p1  ORF type:complete len:1235 (+),score=314.16 gb/GECH01000355.1/:1-3705(+)